MPEQEGKGPDQRKGPHHLVSTAEASGDIVHKEGIPSSGVTVHISIGASGIKGLNFF